jgi:hypothetical protein
MSALYDPSDLVDVVVTHFQSPWRNRLITTGTFEEHAE